MTATVKVMLPHTMGKNNLLEFARAIMAGGEVSADGLLPRIRAAAWLATVIVDGKPVGVGALKRPTLNHRAEISEYTDIDLADYPYEMGWIVIHPKYRGQKLSRLLVSALLEKAGNSGVFVTVRADNAAIQTACRNFGFADTGKRWQGERGMLGLGLWSPADQNQLSLAV